ncbi:MAG: hypothetical protein ACLQVD_14185 [Capsulimonadaceae bacterium]
MGRALGFLAILVVVAYFVLFKNTAHKIPVIGEHSRENQAMQQSGVDDTQ